MNSCLASVQFVLAIFAEQPTEGNLACFFTKSASYSSLNLSLGFPTKRDSNQYPQLHRLARNSKFHLKQV